MITWLKQRLVAWAERYQQREMERLLAEGRQLKAELLRMNDGQPIQLTPAQKQRLVELRQKVDPEVLKRIDRLSDAE